MFFFTQKQKKKPNIHDSSLGQIEFEHKITTDEDHLCRYYKSSKKQQKVKSIIKNNNTLKKKTPHQLQNQI